MWSTFRFPLSNHSIYYSCFGCCCIVYCEWFPLSLINQYYITDVNVICNRNCVYIYDTIYKNTYPMILYILIYHESGYDQTYRGHHQRDFALCRVKTSPQSDGWSTGKLRHSPPKPQIYHAIQTLFIHKLSQTTWHHLVWDITIMIQYIWADGHP